MAGRRVADAVVETLLGAGVRRIYGIAGDSLNGITEALRTRPEIAWVHTRHEEAAAFAAAAEAQLTGELAVCAGSCGPGNLHLINGLFDAQRSRAPVLALAAQVPSREIGSGYFQETRPERLFVDCSHYVEAVTGADQLYTALSVAIGTARSRQGVAVVVLPGDVALLPAPEGPTPSLPPLAPSRSVPPEPVLAAMADRLNRAGRVTILAGIGCAGARPQLLALAGRLQAPVVHALRGKEHVEADNPFDVGMTGLLGFASGYKAMGGADLLLMLGTDFPYRQFYPAGATVVQVDRLGEQIGRRTHVDLAVVGDVGATLDALLPRLAPHPDASFLESMRADYAKARAGLDELAREDAGGTLVHPQMAVRIANELAAPNAIFTCDVGTPTVWAARYLTLAGGRRLLGSFVHGSMANALPQAIGAQLALPDRQVVCLSGDGGLAMQLGELLTLGQHRLPVKILLFRNDALAFVNLEMEAAGFLPFATDLVNPDFARIAEAAGLLGLSVARPAEVRPAIARAFAHPGPALVELRVDRQELSMPPSLSWAEIKGFGIFLVKAVLSGRGDEVVDLAKVNLGR